MSASRSPPGLPMALCIRSSRWISRSRSDENAEVAHERPVHPKRVRLDEFQQCGTPLDPFLVREYDRQMAAARKEFPEGVEGARVESIDRLAPRRRGPSIRRIRRDPEDRPRPQREPPGIRNGQIGSSSRGPEGLPRPQDHITLPVDAYTPESQFRGLQEDPSGAAKRVEDRTGHRHPRQVHEGPRELRVEGNRKGERSVRDFRRFQPRTIDAMQDATEDELFAEQDAVIELRRVEIHTTRLAESRTQGGVDRARVQARIEAVRTDAERAAAQFLSRRERPNRIEISGCELLADDVSEAEPMRRSLDGADDIEAQEVPTERRALNLDALRRHRGEGLRPGERRVFPGQLDEDAHGRRTPRWVMRLPTTVIFKWAGPFAPLRCGSALSSRTTSPRSRRSSGKRCARTIRPRCTSTSIAGGGTASSSPISTATRWASSPP